MKKELTEEQRLARNQRMKEWREKNKKRLKQYVNARNKSISDERREKRNEYIRKWRRENKEKVQGYNEKHFENRVQQELEKRLAAYEGEKSQ